jgi:hypothetical protein
MSNKSHVSPTENERKLRAILAASAAVYRDRTEGLDELVAREPPPSPQSPSRNPTPKPSEHLFVGAYQIGRRS